MIGLLMAKRYVRLYVENVENIFKNIDRMSSSAKSLMPFILSNVKTADRLTDVGKTAISEYCGTSEPGYLEQVETVCFSLEQAAREVFNGNKTQAKRARNALVSADVLALVRTGTKGRASLYILLPLPDRYTKSGENVYESSKDRYTPEAEKVHTSPQIGTHLPPSDQGEHVSFQEPSNNIPGGEPGPALGGGADSPQDEKPVAPYCPECGKLLGAICRHGEFGFGCKVHGLISKSEIVYR